MKTALLLSGGMDSVSIAWWKRPSVAITLNYGQLAAEAEIAASRAICKQLNIPHHVVEIDCRHLGSGDMAGSEADHLAPASDWWPYRNQMLVTLAGCDPPMAGYREIRRLPSRRLSRVHASHQSPAIAPRRRHGGRSAGHRTVDSRTGASIWHTCRIIGLGAQLSQGQRAMRRLPRLQQVFSRLRRSWL